jgi:hypothetical protein
MFSGSVAVVFRLMLVAVVVVLILLLLSIFLSLLLILVLVPLRDGTGGRNGRTGIGGTVHDDLPCRRRLDHAEELGGDEDLWVEGLPL